MKRIACVIICLMIPVCVFAENIDLSSLSFDELNALQQQISKEIVLRPEWKETIVPSGIWVVGQDIPAGVYCVSMADDVGAYIQVDDPSKGSSYSSIVYHEGITQPELKMGRLTLIDGYIVTILHGPLKFSPAISLEF